MLLLSLNSLARFKVLRLLLPIPIGLCLFLPVHSQGAEWSLKGSVDQNLSYDDNVFMQVNPQRSFKYMIIPVLTFQHKTDVSEVNANASYGTQLYTDIEGFDQDIQNYGLRGLYKTERFDWGLTSSFSVTPTRNTAVQNSGVFNNKSESNTWSVSPSVSYKLNDIDSIILSPSYSETTFTASGSATANPGAFNNNFNNYSAANVNLAWQRLWSERYISAVGLFYSRYDSQPPVNAQGGAAALPTSFDSVGINFSNTYLWSDNWKLIGTIGGRHTESTTGSTSGSSLGYLADASVNYTGEQLTSGLHFNRSLTPSNLGRLQEQTSVDLNFNYQILERLSTLFTASYQESTFVNSVDSSTRKNLVFQPSINWRIAPEWSLGGSYRYRLQDGLISNNNIINGEADSNLFMVTINYNWQGLRLSR